MKLDKKNFSEWYQTVLEEAEIADQRYNVKGFTVHRPTAAFVEKKMYDAMETELERKGHKRVYFPSVIPEENFDLEKEHVEKFSPEVFWITHAGDNKLEKKIALRPTSETAMYKMYSLWVRSWRDLPLKLYQSCQIWRYDTKATKPFFRDREFLWIEAHDVFETEKEAHDQVLEDGESIERVYHGQWAVPFLFLKRPEWDKFGGAVATYGADAVMPDGKILQTATTHLLGQNFSKPFHIAFSDKNEKEHFGWQTCFGPGISRTFGALMSIHGDDRGLVLPFSLAPTQIVIVPIIDKGNKEKVLSKCKELKKELSCFRVVIDDSDDKPGSKYYRWELRGVPIRLEMGGKELSNGSVTLVRRDAGKREEVKIAGLEKTIIEAAEHLLRSLRKKADEHLESHIYNAKTVEELKESLKKGGFVRVDFCSTDSAGYKCAEVIEKDTGAQISGTLHGKNEKPKGKCIICGKQAKEVVYIARSY
jgi:prolyl-tRNA synthetase